MNNSAQRLSFARHVRLLHGEQYDFVFRQAARCGDRYFTVLSRPNGLTFPRLGLAISKKNIRFATQRNRIKRIVRESFRTHQSKLHGVDIVVMAKTQAARQPNTDLFEALIKLWERLKE